MSVNRVGGDHPRGGITYDIPVPRYTKKPGAGRRFAWAREMAKEMRVGASRYFDHLEQGRTLISAIKAAGGHAIERAEGDGVRIWRAE
jgi:hypothetical protein